MIIGIDFGNSNSFPAYVSGIDDKTRRGGVDVCLLSQEQARLGIPSIFHYRPAKNAGETEFSYGFAAKTAKPIVNQRDTLKRRLTTKEVIAGRIIHYDDVITGIIKHIVDAANDVLVKEGQARCNKISLAYPVVFKLSQKEHLKNLAERAVLSDGTRVQVMGMIQEPAAAALEYLSCLPVTNREQDTTVLVYDLGGGTFDTAIVTAHQDATGAMTSYEVLDQTGLNRAGNEFTDAMVNLILSKLRTIGAAIDTNDAPMARLRKEAEELKIALSAPDTTRVEYEDNDGNLVEITRAELEEATASLVGETISIARQTYNRCPTKPTAIVMVGGQSQMPIIRTRLQREFPNIDNNNIIYRKPQQAIALGAARFADLNIERPTPTNQIGDGGFVLRTTKMLGLAHVRSGDNDTLHVDCLIPRNTPIPLEHTVIKHYHPTYPCTKHTIYLWEALVDDPDVFNESHFTEVAKLTIDFNITMPARPDFDVHINIDKDNLIRFSATDPSGKFQNVQAVVDYTIS